MATANNLARSAPWDLRARCVLELRRRRQASPTKSLPQLYAFNPVGYIRDRLGWEPWEGTHEAPGQIEVLRAYTLALRQQFERLGWEHGELHEDDLEVWKPGEPVQNWIRIEAGHTVGKTKLASGITSHFFDCFVPSIGYTFAPGWDQINDLLWKEIRADREGRGLPGRVYEGSPEMRRSAEHFVKGRATNNAKNTGTERIQGQHGKHLIFVLDEAEGIAEFVWDAMDSMTSGGVVIVLMLANPKSRTSRFHKVRTHSNVQSFRISCLHHPNVIQGREVVHGAVRREWVAGMIEKHCEVVPEHDPDDLTFSVPFPVRMNDRLLSPGTVFRPSPDFMWRVLGRAPINLADNTFVPVGRYETAKAREPAPTEPYRARMGIDVARFGSDAGTLYVRWNGMAWRWARFARKDTNAYARGVRDAARWLADRGVSSLHVRVDGGGGFGGGLVDKIGPDLELRQMFDDYRVLEVHFNGTPHDGDAYADLVTEMYGEAAETLKGLALPNPPDTLEADLTERTYGWVNRRAKDVKKITPKDRFRDDVKRSPDDGDGFVLAVAPDFLFEGHTLEPFTSTSHYTG
ncbi:MAG TPA: hypothetical protein VLH75_07270 [Longimicrobiales bacterium]|nr:hypothetical protein [Longimicrobiales bacterium]